MEMPRLLELFSGTGSVGKVARELGWDVVSFDVCPKYKPDFCRDIMDFDFSLWPQGHFDMIWASPPCEKFSVAPSHLFDADQRAARAEEGCLIARRTREVIDYLKPKYFVVENPNASGLWRAGIFDDYTKVKVSYCKYGFLYRKNTRLATNVVFEPRVCKWDCGAVRQIRDARGKVHLRHQEVAKQGISAHCRGLNVQCTTHRRDELYKIPAQLVQDILEAAQAADENAGA